MANLGTSANPAVLRVRTQARAEELLALCDERGWKAIVGIEPDAEEEVSDLERLLLPQAPIRAGAAVGRNDPCPCGSGRKFKKCCGP